MKRKKQAQENTKLRNALTLHKMSAAQLANKIGTVSARSIQAIAQGKRQPSIEVARKIAKGLRTKVDSIFF